MKGIGRLAALVASASLLMTSTSVVARAEGIQRASEARSGRPPSYLVVALNVFAPAGEQTFGSVPCPVNGAGKARVPYSGGVTINSASLSVNVNSSFPDGRSWSAYVNNASGANASFNVWAVCALPKAGYTVVTVSRVSNPAQNQAIGIANCPTGTKVLGGGILSWSQDLGVNVFSSFPVRIGVPWGWYGVMNNASSFDTVFDVEVVCSKYSRADGYALHNGGSTSPAGQQTFGSAPCLSHQVPIGGGVQAFAGFPGYLFVNIQSTWPLSGSGWGVVQNNGSSSETHFGVTAICAG